MIGEFGRMKGVEESWGQRWWIFILLVGHVCVCGSLSRRSKTLPTCSWMDSKLPKRPLASWWTGWMVNTACLMECWRMKPGRGDTIVVNVTESWCPCRGCVLMRGAIWPWPCLPARTSTAASIAPLFLLSGTSKCYWVVASGVWEECKRRGSWVRTEAWRSQKFWLLVHTCSSVSCVTLSLSHFSDLWG